MRVTARLTAFAGVLAAAFGAAAVTGTVVAQRDGGISFATPPAGGHTEHAAAGRTDGGLPGAETPPDGLAVSDDGLTLAAPRTTFAAGRSNRFSFRIVDARGRALRDEFELDAEREMHLIVVRRDTAAYQHVHPTKGPYGTWSVDLKLGEAGVYRAYADFMVGGRQRTLATDLFVPGDFQPERLAAQSSEASADGYEVALEAPDRRAGRASELSFRVSRDGRVDPGLEPYLGARGHLVALREGDLAYLHVHPEGGPGEAEGAHGGDDSHAARRDGGEGSEDEIRFAATFPTPGRYRLFLQFQVDGRVRTVDHTLDVPR